MSLARDESLDFDGSNESALTQDFRQALEAFLEGDASSSKVEQHHQTDLQYALSKVLALGDDQITDEKTLRAQYMLNSQHVDSIVGALDELKRQQTTSSPAPKGNVMQLRS